MKQTILAGMSISERLIIKMYYCLRQPLTVLVFSITFLIAVSPSPTFAKASLSPLASTYQGTVHNTTFDHTATLTLTALVQNQGEISGNAIIGPGLIGSGPFTGTIMSNRSVSFTDVSTDGSNITIFFTGSLYRDGSLSGTYTIPSTKEQGIWQVIPSPTVDLQTLTIQPLQPLLANSDPTFRATIRNNGSAASGNFNIRWIADGKVFDGGHNSITAGTVDTHDYIWSNITAGQHTLTFIANFDHTIAETTTRNNLATLTFTVRSDGHYVPPSSATWCECTTYVANYFGLSNTYPNAKDWPGWLSKSGWKQVLVPSVGNIVVFQPQFGPGIDQTAGHVGIITAVQPVDNNFDWHITVEGSNQGTSVVYTKDNCTNVLNTQFMAYPKSDTFISYWTRW